MNTPRDGEEGRYPERLAPGLPLSAPTVADILPGSHVAACARHQREPEPPGPGFAGPNPAPADPDPAPAGPPGPDSPGPARFASHAAGPPGSRPAGSPAPRPPQAGYLITGSPADDPPEDPTRVILRKHLDALRVRAANASSWQEASGHYARLVNRDGVVPVTARFSRDDIEFLGRAREEVLGFAELGLRLLDLHAPLDAGGISTDPSSPILRCRSCMWRWPCPTFGMLTDAVSQLGRPGSPPSR